MDIHPATQQVLDYFGEDHSEMGCAYQDLALALVATCTGPELTVALRKLLESSDAARRATA